MLETDNEVALLLAPFQTALKTKAMQQLEGMTLGYDWYAACLYQPIDHHRVLLAIS